MENGNASSSSGSSTAATVMSISFLTMGAATVIINICVICIIITHKWMRSHANIIICSMAGTDVIAGLVAMTVGVVQWTDWFPRPPAFFCKVYFITDMWSVMASVAHVLVVNVERYLAIVLPLRYKEHVSGARVRVVLLCIWIVTLAEATVIAVVIEQREKCLRDMTMNPGVAFGIMTVGVIIPFISVLSIYIHIIIVVVKKLKFMAQSSNVDEASLAQSQRKMFVTVSAILASWGVCWLPFLFIMSTLIFAETFDFQVNIEQFVYVFPIIETMVYANSFLNPILYFVTSADFRKAALLLVKCKSIDPVAPITGTRGTSSS